MTRDEILAMTPGPELDVELAIHALGWRWLLPKGGKIAILLPPHQAARCSSQDELSTTPGDREQMGADAVPPLSSTWEGMRLVVEGLKRMGKVVIIKADGLMSGDFEPAYTVHVGNGEVVRRNDAPHAVAIAARMALEGDHAR